MEYRAPPAAKRRYSGVLQNELQTAVPPSHARPAPPPRHHLYGGGDILGNPCGVRPPGL